MDPELRRGVRQILERQWYEAHETLEVPWMAATGERRRFLQGLIQGAVALEHLRRGNPRGARGLLRKMRARIEGLPPWIEGVGIGPWSQALAAFFAAIDIDARVAAWAAGQGVEPLPPEGQWPLPPLTEAARQAAASVP